MPTDLLVLNASPKPSGESMSLALKVVEAAGGDGGVPTLHLYRLSLRPCVACLSCARDGKCVLDAGDDMAMARERIHAARGLVVASPLHFTSLAAPLIALFSRLEPEWLAFEAAGRPMPAPDRNRGCGALAVTGGGDYRDMFEPARRVAAAAFNTLGLLNLGMATAGDTARTSATANPAALRRAAELGRALGERLVLS